MYVNHIETTLLIIIWRSVSICILSDDRIRQRAVVMVYSSSCVVGWRMLGLSFLEGGVVAKVGSTTTHTSICGPFVLIPLIWRQCTDGLLHHFATKFPWQNEFFTFDSKITISLADDLFCRLQRTGTCNYRHAFDPSIFNTIQCSILST